MVDKPGGVVGLQRHFCTIWTPLMPQNSAIPQAGSVAGFAEPEVLIQSGVPEILATKTQASTFYAF
jgi:hypothetical protein